jgi:hypothetical protein
MKSESEPIVVSTNQTWTQSGMLRCGIECTYNWNSGLIHLGITHPEIKNETEKRYIFQFDYSSSYGHSLNTHSSDGGGTFLALPRDVIRSTFEISRFRTFLIANPQTGTVHIQVEGHLVPTPLCENVSNLDDFSICIIVSRNACNFECRLMDEHEL